jgi:hypothetical protein
LNTYLIYFDLLNPGKKRANRGLFARQKKRSEGGESGGSDEAETRRVGAQRAVGQALAAAYVPSV